MNFSRSFWQKNPSLLQPPLVHVPSWLFMCLSYAFYEIIIIEGCMGDCVSPTTFRLAFCANTFLHSSESFIKMCSVLFIEVAILQSYQTQELVRALGIVRPLHCTGIFKRKFILLPPNMIPVNMFCMPKCPFLGVKTGRRAESISLYNCS